MEYMLRAAYKSPRLAFFLLTKKIENIVVLIEYTWLTRAAFFRKVSQAWATPPPTMTPPSYF